MFVLTIYPFESNIASSLVDASPQFIMSTTETTLMHGLQQRANLAEQEQNTNDNNERDGRQQDPDKNRLLALVGSAVSQLPIWGTPALRYPILRSD
jgi:hypothetical protein